MLFPEEHSPHLKKWIVKRLENTSDADADVLADYVLALLRHDGDVKDVRKLCEEEIPDFLKEDSSVFVSDVFDAIAYRSYLPGAPPPPPKQAPLPDPAAAQPLGSFYDDIPMPQGPAYPPQPFQNGSRKRGYNDWDDPNTQNNRDAGFGGRPYKQPRRGRGGRQDDVGSVRGAAPSVPPFPPAGPLPGQGPPVPSTVGYFDPSRAMDAMFGMSLATGHPMPELLSQGGHLPKRRTKCRDWEKKGYCQRGSNCMFEHSNDPIYPLPGGPFGGMQPLPQTQAVEEYDPNNALMPGLFSAPGPLQGQQPFLPEASQQQPRHKGGKHPNRQRRAERAPFSTDGPVFDRTKSTIVVENIPEENFNENQVKDFFSQFGTILEVSMQPYKRLAIVKFDSWAAANAAYQSPKVIFDNRFVKVFWYKDDGTSLPASGVSHGHNKAKSTNGSLAGADKSGAQTEIDMDDFMKKQEERQKAFAEKTKRMEELQRQQQDLEKRQKELLAKRLEEKARLEAKLAERNGTKSGEANEGDQKPSKTEALRAQLAALEAEAREMGLDPDAVMEAPAPWSTRGGSGYMRGRGGWRGSSTYGYNPRGSYGYRGGPRGRANVHAAYAAYSLDNRPKKVILTGVDFTVSEKDETLRQYLFGIGEFTDIQSSSSSTEITFKDRKTAEKFFNSVLLNNKEIPGIEGALELTWGGSNGSSGSLPTTPGGATTTNPSTPGPMNAANGTSSGGARAAVATTATATATKPRQQVQHQQQKNLLSDDVAGSSSSDKDVHILLERPPLPPDENAQDQNMDYEVADENQWGY
ncbi:RNA-binding protein 26 [Madurella mycetomatis]|uniref:RNA-binding protein 26 n=1 Tax=Madurella mycetomatis TaxID=100816 RepID=A0A175W7S9_9PEZI|nr:RNA-binding protein 26 [Madurella mycetomatis]